MLVAALAATLLAGGPLLAQAPASSWSRDDAAHLLRRAGFGGTPDQIDHLHHLGRSAAVDYLLGLPVPRSALAATPALPFAPAELPAFALRPELSAENLAGARRDAASLSEAQRTLLFDKVRRLEMGELARLRAWWLDRMIRTDRPLEEKMTLFWHGLFTSAARDVRTAAFVVQQNQLLRREALGNYRALADAILRDPAMLRYLNNDQNVKGKPNENLARELMELFTLGEGRYTEQDVKEAARALTGASVGPDGYVFRDRLHDAGTKVIFGQNGTFQPDDVVRLIFNRPDPAQYLARRLWVFFAYPDPSDADVAPVAQALLASGWELKPALRALFNSPAFYSEKARFALIKSPTELLVSTIRVNDQEVSAATLMFANFPLRNLGQELFEPPNVRGWPGGEHWISTATLYARYNLVNTLVNGTPRARGGRMAMAGGPPARRTASQPASAEADVELPAVLPSRLAALVRAADEQPAMIRETVSEAGLAPVNIHRLFRAYALMADPSPSALVDLAVDRYLQRPLHPDKRQALLDALGTQPIVLGQPASDLRVRQMITLLLSTPEYQVQ